MSLPAMTVNTWALDGVSFGTGPNASGFAYLVKSSKGWVDGPDPRPDLTARPAADGAFRGSNYNAPRVVELEGLAQCTRRADRDALADTLSGLCRNPDTIYSLVRNEYSRSLALGVERQGRVSVTELPDGCTLLFNIQVVGTDPRKYSTVVKTAVTAISQAALNGIVWDGPAGTTGAEWDGPAVPTTGLVWQASSGVSGIVSLTNAGTDSAPIVFTINAPSSGTMPTPTLTDITRGFVITYGGTLVPGDVLIIDTKTGRCTLNGNDVGGLLTRADFFQVPARSTIQVQFSAGGPADTAQLTANWSDAY